MSNERSPTQYKGVRAIAPPDLTIAKIAPPANFKPTVKGQLYLDTVAETSYMWSGLTWIALGSGTTGAIVTLTGNSGGAISPVAGNIDILGGSGVSVVGTAGTLTISLTGGGVAIDSFVPDAGTNPVVPSALGVVTMAGTANQITTTGGLNSLTFSLPAAITAPGSLTTTTTLAAGTTLTAGTGITATTGNITASTGNLVSTLGSVSAATTVTAGTGITATTGNIVASAGNISSTSGSVSAGTSMTAATTITSTLGNITATNGNFVASTAGTGILLNSSQASGAAASPVVVNGRSGRATFTSVSIAAAADLTLTITNSAITASTTEVMLSMSGATTGSALSIKSKTASAGSLAIVVTNGTGATTTTADIQIDFLVLNT